MDRGVRDMKRRCLAVIVGIATAAASCRQQAKTVDPVDPQAAVDVRICSGIAWPESLEFSDATDNWLDGLLSASFKVSTNDVKAILSQGQFTSITSGGAVTKKVEALGPPSATLRWHRSEGNSCFTEIHLNTTTGLGCYLRSGPDASGD